MNRRNFILCSLAIPFVNIPTVSYTEDIDLRFLCNSPELDVLGRYLDLKYRTMKNFSDEILSSRVSEHTRLYELNSNIKLKLTQISTKQIQDGLFTQLDNWDVSFIERDISIFASRCYDVKNQKSPSVKNDAPTDLGLVQSWGPRETSVGKAFNKQANGNSAIWINITGLNPKKIYTLSFGDLAMVTTVNFKDNLVTANLTPSMLSKFDQPASLIVKLHEDYSAAFQVIGYFQITDTSN